MLTRQWFLAFVCTARTKIIAHVKGPKTAFRYEKAQRPGAVSLLINWCIEPSQPLGIISGLKETFTKRYIVERTNKAEMKSEEQSEKTESCRENLLNAIQLKRPQGQKYTQEQNKKECASSVG